MGAEGDTTRDAAAAAATETAAAVADATATGQTLWGLPVAQLCDGMRNKEKTQLLAKMIHYN